MSAPEIPDTLKTTFNERCLAVVNRGIGKVSLEGGISYEIEVGDVYVPASYMRGELVTGHDNRRTILWKGLCLSDLNVLSRSVDTEHVDEPVRPTVASEDVIRRYMLDDIRSLVVPDIGASMLMQYFHDMDQAEALGLLDVSVDDVLDAISDMDGLIAAHDGGSIS